MWLVVDSLEGESNGEGNGLRGWSIREVFGVAS